MQTLQGLNTLDESLNQGNVLFFNMKAEDNIPQNYFCRWSLNFDPAHEYIIGVERQGLEQLHFAIGTTEGITHKQNE